ncbi:hypothetical protein ASPWEDRAFT_35933 [Aspergillus wentii DTO 134E9]|uniref:Uncharacterized protein n=1 Tax=Aspergillus wentii DTO 134E9 TaxID=1073089 RepID=A0A1L9RU34_ASPWE|nr:uncharacterized protein ASPWEDRAFT_35933 [Aspergillus wentii DTO 134E9]OJJ38327.1 hypothetical protein ASPWEDRAFT_35933 [Aspergillus wentii DTO 134E9]
MPRQIHSRSNSHLTKHSTAKNPSNKPSIYPSSQATKPSIHRFCPKNPRSQDFV